MNANASMRRLTRALSAALAAAALAAPPGAALASDPPHDVALLPNVCRDCHVIHGSTGPVLTSKADNQTLCLSCHSTQAEPTVAGWAASDQAVPGTSGTSHSWSGAAVAPHLGAALPASPALRNALTAGLANLQCSTCHDQHSQAATPFDPTAPTAAGQLGRHLMRVANGASELCVDCHAAWNQASASSGTYYQGAQATFGSASAIVTGTGTSWTTQLAPGSLVKRQGDTAAAWTVVKNVDSNTQLTLVQSYKGTSGTNVPWDAARMLTHPVGVPLPAADPMTRAAPVETTGAAQVAGFWGAATGGTTTSLTDGTKNFTGATGLWIRFTTGANRNLTRQITSVGGGNTTVNFAAVGVAIAAGTRYEIDRDGNLTNNLALVSGGAASFTTGNVACLTCHEVHFGDSDATTYDDRPPATGGDGHVLRRSAAETCDGCHPSTTVHSSATTSTKHGTWGAGFDCRTCHTPHQTSNVHLVTPSLATPNLGTVAVDFRASASGQAVKGNVDSTTLTGQQTTGRGPCEACHTDTRNGNEYTAGTVNVSAAGVVTCNSACAWTASQFVGWEFRVASDIADKWTRITANTTTGLTLGSASGNVYVGTKSLTNVAYVIANPRFRGLSAGRNNLGSGEGAAGNEHYETNCLQCHPHDKGFAAGESSGGSACDGCHGDIWNRVTGTTTTTPSGAAIVSRHGLGNVPATNASPNDTNLTWGNPLSANAAASRSCVNMCHDDHPHTAGATTHEYNAYRDATSQASRAATTRDTATKAKTDFDAAATNGGLCLSCHRNPVDASHPAVDKAAFTASKHNYTSNTVGASTYTWTYGQHDGGLFDRNCTKCHNDPGDASPSDTSQPFAAVHFSRWPSLLFGNVNPAAAGNTLGGYVCYQCHGDGTTGLDRSGVPMVAVFNARTSSHPVASSAVHDTATELATSYEGQASGGTRHANCIDCHDPHAAGAAQDTGTVASPTATGFTDASKSGKWNANQWVGYRAVINPYATTPAGSGQAATVTASSTTGQITVASWPAGTPPAGATYELSRRGMAEASAATAGAPGVTVTGTSVHSVGQATFKDGTNLVFLGAGGGMVTAVNTATITFNTALWTSNQWATYTLRVVTGAAAGTERTVSSNAASTVTMASAIAGLAVGDLFVLAKPGAANNPSLTPASLVGGYVRNELDRNGRWYRITAAAAAGANGAYQLTVAPSYTSGANGSASPQSNTRMTNNVTAPAAQWWMDYGTLYSVNYGTTLAATASATLEYQICLRCHSSRAFGDTPPQVPSGHLDGGVVAETNVARDFGAGQLAYHPVFAPGANQPTAVAWSGWNLNAAFTRIDNTGNSSNFGLSNTFTTGWYKESLTRCSDCHASDTASDPLGPHGSGKKWLLRGLDTSVCWTRRNSGGTGWETICNSAVPSTPATEASNFCLNCHRWDVYGYIGLRGNAPASTLSRVPHDVTGNNNTYGSGSLPASGIVCNQCHGGDRIGGAHGSSRRKYPYRYDPSTNGNTTISAAPGSYSGKRLLNGAYWFGVTRATTSAGVACWGKTGTDTVSLCGHGHANAGGNTAQYSYDDAPDG